MRAKPWRPPGFSISHTCNNGLFLCPRGRGVRREFFFQAAEDQEILNIKAAFDRWDLDRDGVIDRSEGRRSFSSSDSYFRELFKKSQFPMS